MWGYLSLLPMCLAFWAIAGIWTVFSLAVVNKAVNLTDGFPYISVCGNVPPQSCIFSQVLNIGAASAAWICILRYYQLRDWGVRKWHNQVILWTGLLCALGTSIVGNFQEKNQRATHLTGAFLAFFVGILYFWLQLFLSWRMKNLPQPGAPWIGPLRLVLCSACFILEVASPSGCPALLVYALRLRHLRVGRRHAAVHPLRPPCRGLLPPGRLHPVSPAGLWQPSPPAGLPHLPARPAVNSHPASSILTPPVPAVWFRPCSRGHPGSERPRPASHP